MGQGEFSPVPLLHTLHLPHSLPGRLACVASVASVAASVLEIEFHRGGRKENICSPTYYTRYTRYARPFTPASPPPNGFCRVNGFLFGRPTFPAPKAAASR